MFKQIGLDFGYSPDYSLSNYYVTDDKTSPLNILLKSEIWGNHALLICAESGAGKTHLCHIYSEKFNVPYVLGSDLNLEVLPELADSGCVVDGIDGVDETLLFHLLNMVKENKKHIVLSLENALSTSTITLPDLHSRLSQAMRVTLDLPDDGVLATVLLKHFSDRKLRLSSDVMSYIMTRMPRSYSGVAGLVRVIDEMSLENKSNITIPFVKKVLDGTAQVNED